MQVKSLLLATALITLPAVSTFAQSAADQPAPTQDTSPTAPATPDTTASPSPTNGAHVPTATPAVVPATLGDLQPGAVVNDTTGTKVGTIESATSAGAVVSTGTARAQIPVASFSKNAQGLVISVTKVQLEAAVAKAAAPKS